MKCDILSRGHILSSQVDNPKTSISNIISIGNHDTIVKTNDTSPSYESSHASNSSHSIHIAIATMQFTLLATALALASTALATPVPANAVNDSLQKQIQAMEITIIDITNDIVQSNPNLKTDYANGINQFAPLISGLEGPQPCSIFTPGRPDTKDQAAASLQKSNLALMELSLDLLDPSKKVGEGDFHADVCQAWAWYNAIGQFVRAQ